MLLISVKKIYLQVLILGAIALLPFYAMQFSKMGNVMKNVITLNVYLMVEIVKSLYNLASKWSG